MKITKKPVTVDAHRFTGELEDMQRWFGEVETEYGTESDRVLGYGHSGKCACDPLELGKAGILPGGNHLVIDTLEGALYVPVGSWVIRGVKGEYYPCRDDILRATYDLHEEE